MKNCEGTQAVNPESFRDSRVKPWDNNLLIATQYPCIVKFPKTTGQDEMTVKVRMSRMLRSSHFFSESAIFSLRDGIFFRG